MLLPWKQRPIEVANLFNPAFCSLLLREAIKGYHDDQNSGLPYILSFLVLPLVLHKPTRDSLPKTIRTRMHVWLQEKPETQIGFAHRVSNLTAITKESVIFGIQLGLFTLEVDGNLILSTGKHKTPVWEQYSEPAICYKRSHFLGRWFAQVGDTSTILTMWGIQP